MTTESTHEAIAAQAAQLLNQGLGFYEQRDFQAALTAWQQAIELRKQLPLDNPEYCNELVSKIIAAQANQLFNQGVEFIEQRDFQAALTAWQQAIELLKQLPLDNPEYRNELVSAYSNCGIALGNLRHFEEAIAQYQQVIELGKHLPLDNPKYCSNLASAYNNYGIALGNLRHFEEAIAQYQQAIELGKQLPLDNPQYRNALARAYNNCGSALGNLRHFEEAIAQYQQVIELGKQLPLDNPEYRNELANAYNNCGNALDDLRRFEEAIAQYQQAIELGKQLPLDNPQYRNELASAYNNCGGTFFNLGHFAEAEDAIEESLSILRQLEQQGIYWFREARERWFETAITIYLSGAFKFLPELILEHLDPVNAGAAPQSERMHQAALNGLLRLFQQVYYSHPKLLPEIEQTVLRLAEIRAKYFTGTAAGAKLTAQFYEENVQDLAKAQQILEHYSAQVSDDPEGYIQLAAFHQRRRHPDLALNTYQTALQKVLLQSLQTEQQNAIVNLLQLIYHLIAQKESWQTETQVDQSFNKINAWYIDWLLTLSPTQQPIIKTLHAHALQAIESERDSWRKHLKKLQLSEFQKHARQKLEIQLHISFQAIRDLPTPLQAVIQTLLAAQQELWQDDALLDVATQNDKIETLQNTLEYIVQKLPEAELAAAAQQLEQELTLWAQLTEKEQQFLKIGMRLYQEKIYVFAATSFGSAVENSLKIRLFEPAKQNIQHPVNYRNDKDDFIAGFFDGRARLMLGNLIGGFNQTFHSDGEVTHPHNAAYLRQYLPHYQPDSAAQLRRRKQLNRLTTLRNQLHHSPEVSPANADEMLEIMYRDQKDGFYRYLLGA